MNRKVISMFVFALLAVCPMLAQAQGMSDDFTGTTIDTNKWVVTPGGGTITQNDVLTMTGPGTWSQTYMIATSIFPRTDGAGGVLRFTHDVGSTSASHFLMGFYAGGVPADPPLYGFYYNAGGVLNPKQGGSQTNDTADDDIRVRCTLDPVQGALWERDLKEGAGWETIRDTRWEGGDTSSEYSFFLMAYGDAYVVDNVVIDYFDPASATPTPTPTPIPTPIPMPAYQQTLLSDDFEDGVLDTAKWKIDAGTVTEVGGNARVPPAFPLDNSGAFSSIDAWPRTDGAGHVLRVAFDVDLNVDDATYWINGLHADAYSTDPDDYLLTLYGWGYYLQGTRPFSIFQGAWGFNEGHFTINQGPGGPYKLRLTLDPVQGALYELDDLSGSGYDSFEDTRGQSGDTDTPAFVLRFNAIIVGAPMLIDNVLVEYVGWEFVNSARDWIIFE